MRCVAADGPEAAGLVPRHTSDSDSFPLPWPDTWPDRHDAARCRRCRDVRRTIMRPIRRTQRDPDAGGDTVGHPIQDDRIRAGGQHALQQQMAVFQTRQIIEYQYELVTTEASDRILRTQDLAQSIGIPISNRSPTSCMPYRGDRTRGCSDLRQHTGLLVPCDGTEGGIGVDDPVFGIRDHDRLKAMGEDTGGEAQLPLSLFVVRDIPNRAEGVV